MPKVARKLEVPAVVMPYWTHPDKPVGITLHQGNVLDVLKQMPSGLVHCAVTSPPYWNLRDYGTGSWEGGDPACDHVERYKEEAHRTSTLGPSAADRARGDYSKILPADNAAFKSVARQFAEVCGKCGAKRIDQQLGSEQLHDCLGWARGINCAEQDWQTACYVCRMVLVFRELRRVLRDDGVFWLDLGDTIDGQIKAVPFRTALALQADGWCLKQDVIWHNPCKMPESVESRCSKAHEYIFMLTKVESGYYFDHEAIKEKSVTEPHAPGNRKLEADNGKFSLRPDGDRQNEVWGGVTKNRRDVWSIPSQGYPGAHYAPFPEKLPETCILASTSAFGCCALCGKPWVRVVDKAVLLRDRPNEYVKRVPGTVTAMHGGLDAPGGGGAHAASRGVATCGNSVAGVASTTLGWAKDCTCDTGDVVPCRVLDPFIGSGTTCAVAVELGRHGIGIDLSETYLRENAIPRIMAAKLQVGTAELPRFRIADTVHPDDIKIKIKKWGEK